jgi:hypothetical protein
MPRQGPDTMNRKSYPAYPVNPVKIYFAFNSKLFFGKENRTEKGLGLTLGMLGIDIQG